MINSRKKGFTLVELVIVIAVVAVLAAVLIPTFSSLIRKANVSNDTALVKNLNTALVADVDGHETMYDALQAAKEFGYDIAKINAKASDNEILWDSVNDCFVYLDSEKGLIYIPNSKQKDVLDYQLWKIYNDDDELESIQKYSIYWNKTTAFPENTNLTVGFDAGETTTTTLLKYVGSSSAQNVVIRTNGGTLNVDAPNDTISWFGTASITIESIDDDSFHAYGNPLGEVRIKAGHYVVENDAETHFSVTGNGVCIDTKTKQAVIILKASTVTNYTVNGIEYAGSAMISDKTKEADIDDTKSVINLESKALYSDLQEAIDEANQNDKLVLLKDVNVNQTQYEPVNKRYYAIGVVDKNISINGNGKIISSNGLRNNTASHDLIMCWTTENPEEAEYYVDFYNVVIESTHYQDVFLINSELAANLTLNLSNAAITCDGECVYSNGPTSKAVLNNCVFTHEGVYAEGKDDRYYSALIVGYGGIINAYNCSVESFGNGITTFPSGGIVNLFNTNIRINAVPSVETSGFAFRVTMENNSYEGLYVIRGAEVNVYGGNFEGNFSLKDTSTNYDAKINIYEGTFDNDPSSYIIPGKICSSSGGRWIVK